MRNRDKATVIYYHSVGPVNSNWGKNFLTVEPELFDKHLLWLRKRYTTISPGDYLRIREGQMAPVRNPLIITFDDGYADNWIWAYPLLKRYGMKATIFVSPEFTDARSGCYPNLEDYEAGRATPDDLSRWGFLSWDEMIAMEKTGLIDIQSHSLTHTKYFVSDKLVGFHHPGNDAVYAISNMFPEHKPYYISDPGFNTLLPWGYPLFEERASLMARKVEINPEFIDECVRVLKHYDFEAYTFSSAFKTVEPILKSYREKGILVTSVETEEEYTHRVSSELRLSKSIIESRLGKRVDFLCWPHGSNDDFLHRLALDEGYLMTTTGKAVGVSRSDMTRLPDRAVVDISSPRRKMRTIFRMRAFAGKAPDRYLLDAYRRIGFRKKE